MEQPPKKNQLEMIKFMKRVTLPRILKDLENKSKEKPKEEPK